MFCVRYNYVFFSVRRAFVEESWKSCGRGKSVESGEWNSPWCSFDMASCVHRGGRDSFVDWKRLRDCREDAARLDFPSGTLILVHTPPLFRHGRMAAWPLCDMRREGKCRGGGSACRVLVSATDAACCSKQHGGKKSCAGRAPPSAVRPKAELQT